MTMRKVESRIIEEQGYKMYVQMRKEAKSKEVKMILLLEEEQGACERTIIGRYLIRNILKKEYIKDVGDRIPALGLYLENKAFKGKEAKEGADKARVVTAEVEQIHKQIEDYCLCCKAETDATVCGIHEAYSRVVEYVRKHKNKSYWWIQGEECIVLYDRLEELLGLVDCGWNDRREFSDSLSVNGLVNASKNGRVQRKVGQKWALRIKVLEGKADGR